MTSVAASVTGSPASAWVDTMTASSEAAAGVLRAKT